MFVHKLGILVFVISCAARAELWMLPKATDLQRALETCQISSPLAVNDAAIKDTDIRCFATKLDLWNDDEGFQTKHFVKLLKKYQQPIEISIVIDFCNKIHKQTDTDKWAKEAFNCFARGRIGRWLNDFIKNVYKNKNNE